ncbi:hypothetical protein A2U01_0081769, partial [Trifolium medium]|nr:hypothetical protein [Trifolium medium]
GVSAARRQDFRKQFLALDFAQHAGLRAGVAVATVVCATRKRVWHGARARCLFIG